MTLTSTAAGTSTSPGQGHSGGAEHAAPRRRRNPAPIILAVVGLLLVIYYVVVALTGGFTSSTTVPIAGTHKPASPNYLELRMDTEDIDLTNKTVSASVLPVPYGDLVGARTGEMSKSLRIEVTSAGATTSVVTFPGKSIIDPTAMTLALARGDRSYPFDQPFSTFRVSVTNDADGSNVPFMVTMDNAARPWVLTGKLGPTTTEDGRSIQTITLDGNRDSLNIMLVLFYVLAILLTTLMAVVTIGIALIKKKLEFSNIIWLSATMLSFPALRGSMPGAPPVGTLLDYIVLFPCLCLIAAMLVWTGAHLLWRESSVLRSRHLDDEDGTDVGDLEAP